MNRMRFVLLCLLPLGACTSDTVKSTLGLDRGEPDEFRVVSRPPLTVPPDFALKPPSASEQSPNQLPSSQQAQSVVLGGGASNTSTPATSKGAVASTKASSSGATADSQFLRDAGADKADPAVRDKIANEHYAIQQQKEEHSWWDIFSSDSPTKDPVVDATKEDQRIKTNEAEGKPVNDGDTVDVKQSDTGPLGRLLGY